MKKVFEYSKGYALLHLMERIQFRMTYRRLQFIGRGNVPKDGAVIYTPNHCNALMDALAVLNIDSRRKVFVARADIFKKPLLQKLLTYIKIMPIHRVRDGFRSVINTEKAIENSIEVLNNQVPFCILPEGTHRPMHSLLPIGKGISRIALGADKRLGGGKHVYIVPVGCEYGDYYRYRTTLLVNVGKPLDVTEYVASHPELSEFELMAGIRTLTGEAIRNQIVWIPDDEDYAATWELCKLDSGKVSEYKPLERFTANRRTAARIAALRAKDPDKARRLFDKVEAFRQARKEAKVSLHAVHAKHPAGAALWRTLVSLVMLPFALACGVASLPGWVAAEMMASTAKDPTFRNTLRFGVLILLWKPVAVVASIVLFCTVKWYWALACLLVLPLAPTLVFQWFEELRRLASAWRYAFNARLRRQKDDLLNELDEWKEE